MITLILAAVSLALYLLGVVLAKECTDLIEERQQDFLPRDAYWRYIFTWPYQIVAGLLTKDSND